MGKASFYLLTLLCLLISFLLIAEGLHLLWFQSPGFLQTLGGWYRVSELFDFFDFGRSDGSSTVSSGWFHLTLGIMWIGGLSGYWMELRWAYTGLLLVAGLSMIVGGVLTVAAVISLLFVVYLHHKIGNRFHG